MKEFPLVTIVTPSYNQGKFIRRTIESVLSQEYENLEYLVIDGGSTDDTLDILKEYQGRLKYISEKDNGQSDAINKGFQMARGEIVAWLNSDDTYEPGCIKRAVEELLEDEKIGLVYADGYITDEEDHKLKVFEYTQEFDFWKLTNFWDYIMQPAAFFRACFLRQIGYLNIDLKYCMDWDLWIRLATVSEVKYVPELWACSREYGETKTSTGGKERLAEITSLLQKYSGKREPLGVVSYRASTRYGKYAKGNVSRKIMGRYLAYVHNRLNAQLPVRYPDGWIGKRFSIVVPGCKKKCRLLCEVVQVLKPNTVFRVFTDNKLIYEKRIEVTGIFPVEFEIDNTGKERIEISIVCSHTFKVPGDDRKLSVRITEIHTY